jgi:multimeric flavodoxin WrbA
MAASKLKVRTGQAPAALTKTEFLLRFRQSFVDPSFGAERDALARIAAIAWNNYQCNRKAPVTRPAGAGFADPDYALSAEWRATRNALRAAERKQRSSSTRPRALVIVGSPRSDGSCPGEISKTFRLAALVEDELRRARVEVDMLDLSLIASDYRRNIHPCKGCVSTAMPLCHWPCSCYPNHATGQTGDWMAEIYERWVAAHGVVIVTPVHWYQAPSVLKLMIDRLVCADGGNPDPSSTGGKDAAKAKALELRGWNYPKHLAGRVYGLVVHGDVAGIEGARRALSDWLDWMGLIDAGPKARLDRFIGYYEPYATSHQALDRDRDLQEEVRNVGRAVARAIRAVRQGHMLAADASLAAPRPK